jgi:hypothetical protein
MQTISEIVFAQKYLFASLVACAAIVLIANLMGEDIAILVGNLLYIPTAGAFFVMAILMLLRFGTSGFHGIAWIAFAGCAISWFAAEILWIVQELYLKIDPFPSMSDLFYLVGYPFLLMFFVAYIQPVKQSMSKQILAVSILFSVSILAVAMYLTLGNTSDEDLFALVLATSYPAFDSMIIIPAILGVTLFFKGKVNFMWTLICFGTLCIFIADTVFLLEQNNDSYYTGNPMEIPFYWNYILVSFGIYYHYKLFEKAKPQDTKSC